MKTLFMKHIYKIGYLKTYHTITFKILAEHYEILQGYYSHQEEKLLFAECKGANSEHLRQLDSYILTKKLG